MRGFRVACSAPSEEKYAAGRANTNTPSSIRLRTIWRRRISPIVYYYIIRVYDYFVQGLPTGEVFRFRNRRPLLPLRRLNTPVVFGHSRSPRGIYCISISVNGEKWSYRKSNPTEKERERERERDSRRICFMPSNISAHNEKRKKSAGLSFLPKRFSGSSARGTRLACFLTYAYVDTL